MVRDPQTKHCHGCGTTKALAEFHRNRSSKDGLNTQCKDCARARARKWGRENREYAAWASRERYAANRDAVLARQHTYRQRPEVRARQRENVAVWRDENRDRVRAYSLKHYRANREAGLDARRKYREANRDRLREWNREWKRRNPDKVRDYNRRHRLSRDETDLAYIAVLERDPCCYCGAPMQAIDHITAISADGPNAWTNYTAACTSCNSSKRDKPLLAFLLSRLRTEEVA